MSLIASAGNGQAFRRVPVGVWAARCISIIDLGTQTAEFSNEIKHQHKVQLVWEVFGQDEAGVSLTVDVDGKEMPLTISKRYTLSLHEKARLRADLDAWRGKPMTPEELKGFELPKLLGAYCLLNVTHNEVGDKTYANISSITPIPRGMPKPAGVHPLKSFDVDAPDMALFGEFHERLQDTIRASTEWQARMAKMTGDKPTPAPAAAPAPSFADMEDDVPF